MSVATKIKEKQKRGVKGSHVKKGDNVKVISGGDKGKDGRVLKVLDNGQRVIVEKVNFAKRHTKPNQKVQQGGIIEKEASLAASNVMLICPRCSRPTRLGKKRLENGAAVRVCRKCGEVIDE